MKPNYYLLACIPKGNGKLELPNPPSDSSPCIVRNCSECEREIWLSERKIKLKEEMDARNVENMIVCMICAANIEFQHEAEGNERQQMMSVEDIKVDNL